MKPGFTIGSQGALAIWKPEIICIAYMVHNGNKDEHATISQMSKRQEVYENQFD